MTTFSDAIAHDYRFMDGVVDVTLRPQGRSPAAGDLTGIKCLRRAMPISQLAAGNFPNPNQTRIFNLWAVTITGGYQPEPDDLIVDDKGTWKILTSQLVTFDTRWRCLALLMP